MKRKVIQIAESTQLVSLPRKWSLKMGIKKGEEIEVTEQGSKLIISTEKSVDSGSIEVDATGLDRDSLQFFLRELYKNGYDEIKINFNDEFCDHFRTGEKLPVMRVLAHEVSRLVGVEIFSQKENYCIIRTISEDTNKQFDTMLRRIFLLLNEAIEDFIIGYEQSNYSLLQTIQTKHDAITRFISYSQRLLNKVGYSNFNKTDTLYCILQFIDALMDLIKYNARELINNKIKASKEGIEICKAIKKSFDLYYDLHYNFTIQKVYEITKNKYEVMKKIKACNPKISIKELNVIMNMEHILDHTLSLANARISLEY